MSTPEGHTDLAPGLYAPTVVSAAETRLTDTISVRMSLRMSERRQYEITELTVAAKDYATITGTLLRKIPVSGALYEAAIHIPVVVRANGTREPFFARPDDVKDSDYLKRNDAGPSPWYPSLTDTDDDLLRVARVFAFQHAISGTPAAAVAEVLRIPRSTADYWIRRAKDRGLIYAEA